MMNNIEIPGFAVAIARHGQNTKLPLGGERLWPDVPHFKLWGVWPEGRLRTASCPLGRVAIVGDCFAPEAGLQESLVRSLGAGHPESLASLPGSYTAFLLQEDKLDVISDIAGQPPVYYRETSEQTVVGSRPSLVAGDAGLIPDINSLLAQLIIPQTGSGLLGDRSSLQGIDKLPNGHILRVTPQGTRVSAYESFMFDPAANLDEASSRLRESLVSAVGNRIDRGTPLSSDFSGGIDSTTIAFLAARGLGDGAKLPVFFSEHLSTPDGDKRYAERLVRLDSKFSPYIFTNNDKQRDFYGYSDFLDTPSMEDFALANVAGADPGAWKRMQARYDFIYRHGGRLHLTGHGGDEVLDVPVDYLSDIANIRHIGRFLRESKDWARLHTASVWGYWRSMRRLARKSADSVLPSIARDLEDFYSGIRGDYYDQSLWRPIWQGTMWFKGGAMSDLTAFLRTVAPEAYPQGALGNGDYIALEGLRSASLLANALRLAVDLTQPSIVPQAPFLDSDVIRASFSVPAHLKGNPYESKHILRKALLGVIPSDVTERRTKGAYDEAVSRNLISLLPAIRHLLLHESYLADAGIIEPKRVLESINRIDSFPSEGFRMLRGIVSAERWLRAIDGRLRLVSQSHTQMEQLTVQAGPPQERKTAQSRSKPLAKNFKVPDYIHAVASDWGSVVFLNRRSNTFHALDKVRSTIARSLASTGDLEKASQRLSAVYRNTDFYQIRASAEQCLRELTDFGIFVRSKEPTVRMFPATAGRAHALESEMAIARKMEPLQARFGERVTAVAAFAIDRLLGRVAPRARLPLLRYLHDSWTNREATYDEAQHLLRIVQGLPYLGRIACLESSYPAALAAGLRRRKVEWHQGVAFAPLSFHAWIEAEGQPVRTGLDGIVTGTFQSFFAQSDTEH